MADGEPALDALVTSLLGVCRDDPCAARLVGHSVPDPATFDVLCASTLLVGSEPHMAIKIDTIIQQLGAEHEVDLKLRAWAAVLWEVQYRLRKHERAPQWCAARVRFERAMARVRTDAVLTPEVLRAMRAGSG